MIFARTITPGAGVTVEIFSELGIDPGRYTVSLHSDATGAGAAANVLVQESAGTHLAFAIPCVEEGDAFQFVTDHDPVYIKNISGEAVSFYVLLSAVP